MIVTPLLLVLILGTGILFCFFKQRKARGNAGNFEDTDENPTYGDYYYDSNPTSEVEDSNVYYASDYEAGTGMGRVTDNNPLYE